MSEIRVLVIDDHPVVGEGVTRLLAGTPVRVIGCVNSIDGAAAFAVKDPQVVLLDLRLGTTVTAPLVPDLQRILPPRSPDRTPPAPRHWSARRGKRS